MTPWVWPLDLRPVEQSFYVEPLSARMAATLSGHIQSLERPAARWRAALTVRALPAQAVWLDALLAAQRGGTGTVLLPDFTRLAGTGSGASFDDHAAAIGVTRFLDATGFDDGTAFVEGSGTPTVAGGVRHTLVLAGCRPGATDVLGLGDLVQTSPGRAHLIVGARPADADGLAVLTLAPPLRAPPRLGPPVTAECRVLMRLEDSNAATAPVEVPRRTTYHFSLKEV